LTGVDGEYYLKLSTGEVYLKQTGVWVKVGSIRTVGFTGTVPLPKSSRSLVFVNGLCTAYI
jgi:hypothetical protein